MAKATPAPHVDQALLKLELADVAVRSSAPKDGGVLRVIWDAVHLPAGATKAEIRLKLQAQCAKGRTMLQMEKTLGIQLSRMPKERGFTMAKVVEPGRGLVYRATYPQDGDGST